ncbi:hypothetical protein Tco_0404985 [Tanacetum coccineum]
MCASTALLEWYSEGGEEGIGDERGGGKGLCKMERFEAVERGVVDVWGKIVNDQRQLSIQKLIFTFINLFLLGFSGGDVYSVE